MCKTFRSVKGILLFIVLVFLLASFSQQQIFHIPETKLAGVSEPKPDTLSWKTWTGGDYQSSMENYLDFHAGFRNSLVRLHNQIDYTIFHLSSNPTLTLGIDNFLFGDIYLEAYTGKDYIGKIMIAKKIMMLNRINQILQKKGIDLILVFPPNKARFYPEYIPGHELRQFNGNSNYEEFIRQLEAFPSISVIDFNRYFLLMKDTVTYPLIPKHGIHWTNHACQTIIPDTLIRLICRKRNLTPPDYIPTGIVYPDSLLIPDYDLYELLNLFYTQSGERIPYPVFKEERDSVVLPVRVLTIGDSFFWNLYAHYPWKSLFRVNDFWFYGNPRYPKHKYRELSETSVEEVRQEFLDHDVVILMIAEINLDNLMHFPENAILWFDL